MGALDDYISALQKGSSTGDTMPFGVGGPAEPTVGVPQPQLIVNALKAVGNAAVNAATFPGDVYAGKVDPLSNEGIGRATNLAGFLTGTGAPAAEEGAAGIFGGKLAKSADLQALDLARHMDRKGMPPEQIHDATGWFQHPADQKWRFEIPDDTARMQGHGIDYTKEGNMVAGPAPAMMDHPELFKAYPQLEKLKIYNSVLHNPRNGIGRGMYSPSQGEIEVEAPGIQRATITGLHELQHGVQDLEGFSAGGNPSYLALLQQKSPSRIPLTELKNDPGDMYERLAGEVEARNVMNRSLLAPDELKASGFRYPWSSMDTPYNRQLHYSPVLDMIRILSSK